MKIYNYLFKEIDNPNLSDNIDYSLNNIIRFINQTTNDVYANELIMRKRSLITQIIFNDYYLIYNGEYFKNPKPFTSGLSGHSIVRAEGTNHKYINSIFIKNTRINNKHVINHEIMHALSFLTNSKEENGYYEDKMGLTVIRYDSNNNIVNNDLVAMGLTEGIAELLTEKYEGKESDYYNFQKLIANILAGGQDKTLIDAYFSSSSEQFKDYLKHFNEMQSTISSKELIDMPSTGKVDNANNIIIGTMEYALNNAKENGNYEEEKDRLSNIVNDVDINTLPSIEYEAIAEKRLCKEIKRVK